MNQNKSHQNTMRDEATTAKSAQINDQREGLASEDQPQWRPPESSPEPRPPSVTLEASQKIQS